MADLLPETSEQNILASEYLHDSFISQPIGLVWVLLVRCKPNGFVCVLLIRSNYCIK